jgi:hypothetical protein
MESERVMQVSHSATVVHCDLALARRLERAEGRANAEFVAARAQFLPAGDYHWIEVAGTYAMFDGVGSPCTQSFGLGLFDTVSDADLARLEAFFEQRGSDVFHEVCPLAESSLPARLCERGYRPIELSNVLVRPIQTGLLPDQASSDRLDVQRIAPDQADAWARVSADGWADAAPGLDDFFLHLGQVHRHRQGTHCFWALRQGQPIATGAISLFEGVGLLAGASTIPAGRRQGAQGALLEHRLSFAAQQGCHLAMIVAQPGSASQRNAERQGFRVAYTRTKWHRPPAPA